MVIKIICEGNVAVLIDPHWVTHIYSLVSNESKLIKYQYQFEAIFLARFIDSEAKVNQNVSEVTISEVSSNFI